MKPCIHNQRCRYTHGFYCEDCNVFFSKHSPTYRSSELLSSIWMVLNNINAARSRTNLPKLEDVDQIQNKIGIGVSHPDNFEELIKEAEIIMSRYGKHSESASILLKE